MVHVIGKPRLQTAQRIAAECAAAIYELFVNPRHFRDVSMDGNKIPVRQKKPNVRVRLFAEVFFEFIEFHKYQEFNCEPEQQSVSRKAQQAGTASAAPIIGANM